jgi:hypothetical protein
MFIGITVDGKMIMKSYKGEYFIAGQYAKPAFNNPGNDQFMIQSKFEVEDIGTIKILNTVPGQRITTEQAKSFNYV